MPGTVLNKPGMVRERFLLECPHCGSGQACTGAANTFVDVVRRLAVRIANRADTPKGNATSFSKRFALYRADVGGRLPASRRPECWSRSCN